MIVKVKYMDEHATELYREASKDIVEGGIDVPFKTHEEDFCYDCVAVKCEQVAPRVYKYDLGISLQIDDENLTFLDNEVILDMAPGAAFEVNTSNTQQVAYGDGAYWKVTVPGIDQLYCAEKGAHLRRQGASYEEVAAHVASNIGRSSDGSCAKPGVIESRAYYKVTSTRKATNAEALILTWPDPEWNSWSGMKQEAVWDSASLSHNVSAPKDTLMI